MASRPKIEIVPDAESLARRSLELFIKAARESVAAKGAFYVAISGGHTPKRFFELLGESTESKTLPWDKVRLFWVDERYVAPDSELSNFKLASDTFLTKVPVHPTNIYRVFTEYHDMRMAAREYEQIIRIVFNLGQNDVPRFDLIFLGLGPDGHIASLFPDSSAIFEAKHLVTVVTDSKTKPDRITLTAPVLCAASHLIILTTSEEKAEILKQVLTTSPDIKKYPVHILWPVLNKAVWLVDSAAAKLL
jgi:6-phosphogluconolactonase